MDWLGGDIWLTWVGLGVLLLLFELFSGELIFLMLGIAGFAAAGSAGLNTPLAWQLAIFGAVGVALLSLVRPRIAERVHAGPSLPSGQHGLVGKTAVVAEEVHHLGGRVQIGDVLWTARPVNEADRFRVGEQVVIKSIDGALALVAGKESA